MGLPAQLTRPRRGAALPAALFGLVTVAVLSTAMFTMSRSQQLSSRNRESTARALQIAESGLAHSVILLRDSLRGYPFTRLLRGSDDAAGTTDDGRLIGYGLGTGVTIPIAGRAMTGGSYRVQLLDDPAETDGNALRDLNLKLLVRCTGTTADGASASVDVVLTQVVLPAFASEGDLSITSSAKVLGQCGAVHANDDLTLPTGGQLPTISGSISASDQVTGLARDTLGGTSTPAGGVTRIDVPDLDPTAYCGDADIVLRDDGFLVVKGNPDVVYDARSSSVFGWRRTSASPVTWSLTGSQAQPGKVCATANLEISGNMGSSTSPIAISFITTKSVSISGTPFIKPAEGDSIAVMAGGDVALSGNASGSASNYEGLVYAGSQCSISGTPRMNAQILCNDQPNPAGAKEYATANEITGAAEITYRCGGILARRRVFSWLQRVE